MGRLAVKPLFFRIKSFKKWHNINLDNLDNLSPIRRYPKEFLFAFSLIVIGEVQKAPEILPLLKNLVDSNKNKRFVLSGFANLLLLKEARETLAGMSLYFPLLPFSGQEWEGKSFPPSFCSSLKEFRPKFWKA
ncbi:MAG: AAA family ATPase [Caldiserica bacterium]|nr:AAA family ATPase [Caldisericota bacterium]